MTVKISALTAGTTLTGTETFPAVQSGSTVKLTAAQIATFLGVAKFAANIGDGTNVNYTVTHNLGTRDVQVKVYRNGTPWDEVIADVAHTTTNTLTVSFSTAPTSNQFRVVVWA